MAGTVPEMEMAVDLEGVWGWLLFFCILTTLVAPMAVLLSPARAPLPLELLSRGILLLGVITGTNLWSRGPSALGMLKVYLFGRFLVASIFLFISLGRELSTAGSVGRVIGSLIGVALPVVWFLYFQSSVRVRATYGRNL